MDKKKSLKKPYQKAIKLLLRCWDESLADYHIEESEWVSEEHEGMLAELARDIQVFLQNLPKEDWDELANHKGDIR
jgi:hypothetical protein|tara:strand:+ start:304 stop:531 length:228 start_codon:yes stop_codon:yes gene_type:complete